MPHGCSSSPAIPPTSTLASTTAMMPATTFRMAAVITQSGPTSEPMSGVISAMAAPPRSVVSAIAIAIDKPLLAAVLYSGAGVPASQLLVPGVLGYDDSVVEFYRYDVAAAKPQRPMTPAKKAALAKAMTAKRTCPRCSRDAGYVIEPLTRVPGRLRLLHPAPQDSAPEPGPTLAIRLLTARTLRPLSFAVRISL